MKQIESYIHSSFGIGGTDLSSVSRLFRDTRLDKGDYLLRIDQYESNLHFVKSGHLRVFGYSQCGKKEVTQWLSSHGMFITDMSSFIFNTPSRWNIQALTDCELFTISRENYQSIGRYVDNWEELDKLFITKCFVALENRMFSQLAMSAEERVTNLLEINPDIFLNVPLKYIASMLGMTAETLSRIRRKMIS